MDEEGRPTNRDEVTQRIDALERSVFSYLSILEQMGKWYGWKNQTFKGMVIPYGVWWAAEKFGRKDDVQAPRKIWPDRIRSMQTGVPGCPDIVGIYKDENGVGRFVGIEMKTGSAVQTMEQHDAERRINMLGGIYILTRSLEDVQNKLLKPKVSFNRNQEIDVSDIPF